ncbi:MAG: hypothetical protein HC769_30015 [Cyanobacteria bacterium CRU_2_1]|nr:hypothetical protein [Cyanobacteria bacterium CRU_2_1]
MLTYLLALAVGFGSFVLYMVAFFFPEIHRKYDLIWSGVGMFYALVLWICADRITGGILLGQMACVALLGWFGWQTLELRWEQTPVNQRTPVSGSANSLGEVVHAQSKRLWAYLQSDEFKSRLPNRIEEVPERASELVASLKEWGTALWSTTFKSPSQSIDSIDQPPNSPFNSITEPANGVLNSETIRDAKGDLKATITDANPETEKTSSGFPEQIDSVSD